MKHYIWKYKFKRKQDYDDFLNEWNRMVDNCDACVIPAVSSNTVNILEIHANIDIANGYYEQWTMCDGIEYEHGVFTNIEYFENEYNGNHPITDEFFDGDKWYNSLNISNHILHKYYIED